MDIKYTVEYNFEVYNIVRQDSKTHIEIVCSCNKKGYAELIKELLERNEEQKR